MPPTSSSVLSTVGQLGDEIGIHMDRSFRAMLSRAGGDLSSSCFVVKTGSSHPFGNFALLREYEDLELAKLATASLEDYPHPTSVFLCCVPNVEVEAHLTSQGYHCPEPAPRMAVDNAALRVTSLPEGCRFQRVTTDEEGEKWAEVLAEGYDVPLPLARLFAPAAQGGADPSPTAPIQWYAVYGGNSIASVSLLTIFDSIAGIYCVATLPSERGRGFGAHVTAEPLRRAAAAGCSIGVLQASAAGYPVYKKLGFEDFGEVRFYFRFPEG